MDGPHALTEPAPETVDAGPECCPRCRTSWNGQAPVVSPTLGSIGVRRCFGCGERFTAGSGVLRRVRTCVCGIPFAEVGEDEPARCPRCIADDGATPLGDEQVDAAIETEIRMALDEEWSFVGVATLDEYLASRAREIAHSVDGAPDAPTVLVVDDWTVRSLALPSGAVLLSVGLLATLEDEAELAFVLAHELAHVAAGDAAAGLTRLGMHALAGERLAPGRQVWTQAAAEVARLGHGDDREFRADERAIAALTAARYDPQSALRLIDRLGRRVARGDWHVQEWALAHPPAAQRMRRLEPLVEGLPAGDVLRVNREVFRRVAGSRVLSGGLTRVDGPALRFAPGPADGDRAGDPVGRMRVGLWIAAVLATLAAIAVLLLR